MTDPWHVTAHTVPRAGHAPHENEDAWATARPGGGLVVAVADGATETAFARAWAWALVEAATETGRVATAAGRARPAHARRVEELLPALPWYAAAKASEGAAAALTVVRLHPDGRFEAEAVGDVCLFIVEAGRVAASWPLRTPEAFSHRPDLVRSHGPVPGVAGWHGQIGPTQGLALATDALAAFLVREGGFALTALAWDAAQFEATVAFLRGRGLRNDDTTLVTISPSAPV